MFVTFEFDPDLEAPVPLLRAAGRPPNPARKSPSEIRRCRRHGDVEFQRYGIKRPTWRCKRCVGEAVTRRKQKLKRMLVEENGGACAVCGYDRCIINLSFHHVDPSTKLFSVNMGLGKSVKSFRAEAEKCVLVCANCHGEIEAGLVESPPAGATFADYGAIKLKAA
jgi:hypothetical protein